MLSERGGGIRHAGEDGECLTLASGGLGRGGYATRVIRSGGEGGIRYAGEEGVLCYAGEVGIRYAGEERGIRYACEGVCVLCGREGDTLPATRAEGGVDTLRGRGGGIR